MKYDYLIVGAGLYGAVFARQMKDAGKKVLVIDKRNHIVGNIYTELTEGIQVHNDYSCAMKSRFRKSGNQMTGKRKSSLASLLA